MKKLLLCALLAIVSTILGAIPENIAACVYYESDEGTRIVSERAILFSADGTFTGLFFYGGTTPPIYRLADNPAAGTYTYHQVDVANAVLTLNDASGSSLTKNLHFSSDMKGATDRKFPSEFFRLARLEPSAPLVNCSNRSYVRAGGSAFAGFVITGKAGQAALIRAVGPSLARFGLTDHLSNPVLRIRLAKDDTLVAENHDWSSESPLAISRVGALVGAFPLSTGAKDAAAIIPLAPGAYICEVTGQDPADSGEAMIEIYLLP